MGSKYGGLGRLDMLVCANIVISSFSALLKRILDKERARLRWMPSGEMNNSFFI